jgi:putative RNA 2'-phosphotransferase
MSINYTNVSKKISLILRHKPWLYELELDEEGWTDLDVLLQCLRDEGREWENLTRDDLLEMIRVSSKQRHEIKGDKIRALYGHSVAGKFAQVATNPPSILYHGTAPDLVNIIKVEGLKPMARQYVHLSVNQEVAKEVGKRKAKNPVILTIAAQKAAENGVIFYQGNDLIWLADLILPEFIIFKN